MTIARRAALILAGLLAPAPLAAQATADGERNVPLARSPWRGEYDSLFTAALAEAGAPRAARPIGAWQPTPRPASGWAPLLSALLPGSGQLVLRQDRFIPYMLAETYLISRYAADRAEGQRRRREYRALAARVARSLFSDTRPPGDWDYYERMEHFVESGVFELRPGGDFDPELDTTTYNGFVWQLARRTFWSHPDSIPEPTSDAYRRSVDFYRSRAVTADYRWSWRDAQLEYDLFKRTIEQSDDAFQRSVVDLSLLLANHVLSTVDALVTVRVRRRGFGATSSIDVEATMPLPAARRAR